ncbi:MAG: serine/threonine-protein phosphatase, partial [Ruminococcaceae bacterium]|nr:serine/threonine-protein phosphatase [Oscillospiraceae bacterium]
MNVYSKTDIGLQRDENQDTVWSEKLSDTACVVVLCDGMGGEESGGLASRMAVDMISKRIKESFSELMSRNTVRNLLITAVSAANSVVYETAQREYVNSVMGTTCVAAIVFGGCAYIVNVGDSRAYHLFTSGEDECIRQVTKDHSHVMDLVERGEITEEQARNHPKRNKITRAVGADYNVEADFFSITVQEGDMILMCTDGLYGEVGEDKIKEIMMQDTGMGDICA